MFEPENFETAELQPAINEVRGPVDSFKSEEFFKSAVKEQAVASGSLEGISFHAFPAVSNVAQKKIRQEALRAECIWEILKEEQSLSAEDRGLQSYAARIIWQATLVEASRRSFLAEAGESKEDPDFYRSIMTSAMEALYPQPDRNIIEGCLSLFAPKIEALLQSDNQEITDLAREFSSKYSFVAEQGVGKLETLDPDKAQKLCAILQDRYQPAFDALQSEFGEINNEVLPEVAAEFLKKTGLASWRVEVSTERNGFSVRAEDRVLECGKRSKEITWPVFTQLMVHEVGVHATRAENGYKLGSQMLAVGLGGYEEAEEGVAILYEKTWTGSIAGSNVDRNDSRYLIGTYASGAIDGQTHDKDETFRFIMELNILSLIASKHQKGEPIDLESITLEARTSMFEHVYRAFRGMPEGMVLTKDMVYKDGIIKAIRFINDSDMTMEEIDEFLSQGKFDHTNPEHLAILEAVKNG